MAVKSIVKASELEGAKRLDAEYYQPKYICSEEEIRSCPFQVSTLMTLLKPIKNGFDYRNFSEEGRPYIRVGDLLFGQVVYREAEKIEVSEAEIRKDVKLKVGDVLFSRKGTFGRSAVVEEAFVEAIISSEVMLLRLKDPSQINPYYLSAFLNSKYGFYQVERRTHGVSNFSISQRDVGELKIPIAPPSFQNNIAEIISKTYREFENSYALYLQAEQILLEELGWDKVALSQPQSYSISLGQAKDVSRVDAEHFQPKYDRLLDYIKSVGKTDLLGDVVLFNKRGLQPTYAKEGNVIVVNSQHLGRYLLNVEATERTDEDFWRNNKRCQLKMNDVLVYSTGAYVGRTNVWLEDSKAIASNHVNIIRPGKEYTPLYLAAYLNSLPGLWQAEMWASGSGQRELYPEDIARFVLYRAPQEIQEKIANLILQSYQARKKAKALLEEAKRKVEEAIEEAAGR
ncbi:MAG: restriction endonuclease subunit S [Chloroflexota bacterium]